MDGSTSVYGIALLNFTLYVLSGQYFFLSIQEGPKTFYTHD